MTQNEDKNLERETNPRERNMDSRQFTAILSSIVSQLTLLIILLSPYTNPSLSSPNSPNSQTLISLLHHFISSTEALSLSLLIRTRKRNRTHLPESDSELEPPPGYPRLVRLDRVDSVLVKDPDSFRLFFKMSPSTFEWLSGLLEPLLECRDPVHLPLNGLSAELRLGVGLFRLTTGSSYVELADRFRVTDRVARFCTKQLCRVLCTNFRFWVGFPKPVEIKSICSGFEEVSGLPNCCGVIGCTRFIVNNCNELDSVAAQIVVDSSCRILNIVAGYHGSKTNIEILKSSTLYNDVESGTLLNEQHININEVGVPQYLIGDKGYPLLPWLMTPIDDDALPGSYEEKYNECHGLITRVSIRKTIASLRNWGILSKPVEEEFRDVTAYIGACAILHNALLLREDFSGLCDSTNEDYMVHEYDISIEPDSSEGCVIRNALATKAKDLSRSQPKAHNYNTTSTTV